MLVCYVVSMIPEAQRVRNLRCWTIRSILATVWCFAQFSFECAFRDFLLFGFIDRANISALGKQELTYCSIVADTEMSL